MIHHIGVFASDFEASRAFYRAALRPLGIVVGFETPDVVEFWREASDTPSLSVERAALSPTRGVHVAFVARDRAMVDAFWRAAAEAGGEVLHEPRVWPEYRAYCAFVADPDGNNIEAVCKHASSDES